MVDERLLLVNSAESSETDGIDADGNGYVDDRLGWDFGDGDNNAFGIGPAAGQAPGASSSTGGE